MKGTAAVLGAKMLLKPETTRAQDNEVPPFVRAYNSMHHHQLREERAILRLEAFGMSKPEIENLLFTTSVYNYLATQQWARGDLDQASLDIYNSFREVFEYHTPELPLDFVTQVQNYHNDDPEIELWQDCNL